jgi:hypothetical protein
MKAVTRAPLLANAHWLVEHIAQLVWANGFRAVTARRHC